MPRVNARPLTTTPYSPNLDTLDGKSPRRVVRPVARHVRVDQRPVMFDLRSDAQDHAAPSLASTPLSPTAALFDVVADNTTQQPWFEVVGDRICKHVPRRDGSVSVSSVERSAFGGDLAADFDLSWLKTPSLPTTSASSARLRAADLFAGCGAMSAGLREACRNLGIAVDFAFAAELDAPKAEVYARNLNPDHVLTGPIEAVLDGELGAPVTETERALITQVGSVDVLMGGPPCQGHSDLNNHTRRNDARNTLVTRMARFAELFEPGYVVVENVQGARHDRLRSASAAAAQLARLGYGVEEIIVDCSALGVPQTRKRYMLVATRGRQPTLNEALSQIAQAPRTVNWAIEDLLDTPAQGAFDTSAVPSSENERRIRYLFEHDLYDLPDEQRPDCHRNKVHSYKSVYGRMLWDRPAQTITTGFGSMGQGRFVHPRRRRTITPHEAARLQTIPDFFDFGETGRTQLQKMIGNSVPPLAMAAVATQLLR